MIPRLVVASKNPDKIAEIEAVLVPLGLVDEIVRGLDWPDVEENGETLTDNALLKARSVVSFTGLPVVADDTGLEVAALGGAPGVRTARFAGPGATYAENVELLLEQMQGMEDRSARFVTVAALANPDGVVVTAEGAIYGRITTRPRGDSGFGYDPVFEVDGRTLAEMGDKEKNQISHRALALRALAAELSR